MIIEKLIVDPDLEVRSETLNKLSIVGEKCDPQTFLEKVIISMSTKLVTDASVHVRASLAEAVCKIAPVVG